MFFLKKKKIEITDFFGDNFVDIHSHLLPGIDDGAKDLSQSIELIKTMLSYGIKNFITTPHVLGDVYPNSSETIKTKLEEVRTELTNQGLDDVTISAAAEYMMDERFSDLLEADDILTLKDNYILVEMSYFSAPLNLYEILFEIQLKGYKPILAHPERYNFFHNDFENYYKLKKAGCLFQLNFLSMTEQYGKNVQQISQKLLKLNMYDFTGSDTHHFKHLNLLKTLATEKNKKSLESIMKNNSKLFL
ncbi:CpsB/CapC family capsule biosynthesis tyrosine phosphatase [Pseudotenacibaculum sp. MALMAid0570]|uniref:tyrosine-protein phosphatase n=1 Tax=Pseudotenacibaculum sp. MALMAid0570 TaxID=3143938 RepID=UPI0032DE6CEE